MISQWKLAYNIKWFPIHSHARYSLYKNSLHAYIKKTQGINSIAIYRMTQKTGTFEKPNKNWRNPRKKFIDRNWTITTCILRDSNPNYQCLKITSCRWRPPPRTHSFTTTTHFKSSRSFVSPCVCVACSAECDGVAFCRACNTSISVNNFFFPWISSIFVGFFKSSRFFVSPVL